LRAPAIALRFVIGLDLEAGLPHSDDMT
jgi:hypothetical protein